MKKILFAAVAVVAMGFASCGNKTTLVEPETDSVSVDSVDTVSVDTLNADSLN